MKSNKKLLSEALDLLHTLEDRTNYDNVILGTAINNLQALLPTINKEPIAEQTIEVGVYYYLDNEGKKVYDFDEMMNEFEAELKKLNEYKL
jgi:hypothetical protein